MNIIKNTMKNLKICFFALISFIFVLFTSCETLGSIVGTPKMKLDSVAIGGIDMEGFTFNVNYSISNPYPISFSIAGVNADVIYNSETKLTSINASEGVSVQALDKSQNTVSFKIPYTTILSLASKNKTETNKEFIKLSFQGKVSLDLSAISFLENKTLSLPFSTSFNVPIFKPSLSVSAPEFQMPSLIDLKNSLISSGMAITKATQIATAIITGNQIPSDILDGIDLNMTFRFNLNVKNEGSCSWNYILDNCSLTSGVNKLAAVTPESGNTISSQSGTIPVSCTLNALQSGRYIVELLNKTAKNPVITIDSSLKFPGVSDYLGSIPLDYKKEIPVSSISKN